MAIRPKRVIKGGELGYVQCMISWAGPCCCFGLDALAQPLVESDVPVCAGRQGHLRDRLHAQRQPPELCADPDPPKSGILSSTGFFPQSPQQLLIALFLLVLLLHARLRLITIPSDKEHCGHSHGDHSVRLLIALQPLVRPSFVALLSSDRFVCL